MQGRFFCSQSGSGHIARPKTPCVLSDPKTGILPTLPAPAATQARSVAGASENLQRDAGAGLGIGQGMVMMFQVISAVSRHCL